jgi:hypothetical protein
VIRRLISAVLSWLYPVPLTPVAHKRISWK